MITIIDAIRKYIPSNAKISPKHWISFNCPCCVSVGESRPDSKSRGGIYFTETGGVRYHCFNCLTTASWEPGKDINNKMEFVLRCFGMPHAEIKKISFAAWQIKGQIETKKYVPPTISVKLPSFKEKELPSKAKSFTELLKESEPNPAFIQAATYIDNRGPGFLSNYEYFWTPIRKNDLRDMVIIPFYWKDKIVGWNARKFRGDGHRYYGDIPSNFLFNNHYLMDKNRTIVLLTEGLFDAIGIQGVGTLGNNLSKEQIDWINNSNKDVILVPDRNKAGQNLIDIAINQGWEVSFPGTFWEEDVIDAADAIKRYGRIYTIKTILDNRESNKISINVKRNKFAR